MISPNLHAVEEDRPYRRDEAKNFRSLSSLKMMQMQRHSARCGPAPAESFRVLFSLPLAQGIGGGNSIRKSIAQCFGGNRTYEHKR